MPKKLAKRLKKLADSTGPGRDAEVQIEWLRGRHLALSHRAGLAWLLARLEEEKRDAYDRLRRKVADGFPGLEQDLRRHLSVYRTEVHLEADAHPPTLGEATAAILRGQLAELADHLAAVNGPGDAAQAHRARISAKRLRYLLEPLVADLPDATPATSAEVRVKRLKGLQDLLGELHDAHVLEDELADFAEEAAAERVRRLFAVALGGLDGDPDPARLRAERRRAPENGILALARQNRERRDRLFAEVDADWLDGRVDGFLAGIAELAREMEGADVP